MSTVQLFFFAMAAHIDVQKKAQDELDRVIGEHRMPCYADRVSLPYIEAIVRECLRWQPVTPIGAPHRSTADDEYRGHFIPKGTLVIANQWYVIVQLPQHSSFSIASPFHRAILHDPKTYPDPDKFNPDRFMQDEQLNPLVKDPKTVAFGFGRR